MQLPLMVELPGEPRENLSIIVETELQVSSDSDSSA